MSKVIRNKQVAQAKLINAAIKRGNLKLAVHLALIKNVESGRQVYLPNAYDEVSSAMSKSQFAGYLSALTADGVYKSQEDGFFGSLI